MQHKRAYRYGLVIAVNIVLLYLLYRWYQQNIHWHEFAHALQTVPRTGVVAALVFGICILALYGQRLAYLLNQNTTVPFWPSFWIISYGFGANNILPLRIGDGLKVYFAKKYFGISVTRLVLVKVMEKFFDLTALLFIGLWIAIIGSVAVDKVHLMGMAAFLTLLFCGAFIAAALAQRDILWISRLRRLEHVDHAIGTFQVVITNPALKQVLGMTFGIWAMTIGAMFMYYTLVFPDVNIRLVDILALVFLTALSLGIPSVPGALGLFEAAVVFYLNTFLKIPAVDALACALVLHLVQAVPQIALMMVAMLAGRWWRRNHMTTQPQILPVK